VPAAKYYKVAVESKEVLILPEMCGLYLVEEQAGQLVRKIP